MVMMRVIVVVVIVRGMVMMMVVTGMVVIRRRDSGADRGRAVQVARGRDHSLAMTGTGGVKDAVEEGQAEQAPGGAAVGLRRSDQSGKLPIELGLLGEYPAEHAGRGRRRRRLRARPAERAALRQRKVEHTGHKQQAGDHQRQKIEMIDPSPT